MGVEECHFLRGHHLENHQHGTLRGGFLTHDSAHAAALLHNQGSTEHDPAKGDRDEHPDGCWKSTKIASLVLGAT